MRQKICIAILCLFAFSSASQRDMFIFTQLKYDGDWDPYPFVQQDIHNLVSLTTSIRMNQEKRAVTFRDNLFFYSPFIVMLNNGAFGGFTEKERLSLKRYLNNGGMLFVEDSSGIKYSSFDRKIREELALALPDCKMNRIEQSHAAYRSFYLIRGISGRKIVNNYLEGIDVSGRTAVIYSQNDLLGSWARDSFGNYFYECAPGGETQRFEAQKLTINIIIFALTGTYKTDVIHKPFIDRKLR